MLITIKPKYRNARYGQVGYRTPPDMNPVPGIRQGNLVISIHPCSQHDSPWYQILHAPTRLLIANFTDANCCLEAFNALQVLNIPDKPADFPPNLYSWVRPILEKWRDADNDASVVDEETGEPEI